MSFFRFFALLLASMSLTVLIGCSTQPPNTASAPTTVASPQSSMAMSSMAHGGKPKININTAILSQLDKLEGMLGVPALSNKIQASRPYGKPEELVSKNVITQGQFDQVKDLVTVEDIALTGEAKDVDYMTKLGLMKGHLLVARELLDLQKPAQAEPHIGHPVEEIYADVEDQLQERNVKEFKTTLINLQDLVRAGAKDKAKVDSEFKTSMKAVDDAIAALPETQRQSPAFVLQVINGLLDTANSEYTAAIANGKITQAIEYQDSRGFVAYANTLYSSVSAQVEKETPESHKEIQQTMADLTKVWPAPLPPATPIKTPTQVSQLIKTVEMGTQKAVKTS